MTAPNDMAVRRPLESAGVEFIDESGVGRPSVQRSKRIGRAIRSASILKDGRVMFNLAGKSIGWWCGSTIRTGLLIRFIGTHRQYEMIDGQKV
jgi:mRNA-degrading endonuclease HigB of HigAB toxin-antitoxin module